MRVHPQALRWGLLGPLIGTVLMTPLIWSPSAELLNGKFSEGFLPVAVFLLIPGTVATLVLLALEHRTTRRE